MLFSCYFHVVCMWCSCRCHVFSFYFHFVMSFWLCFHVFHAFFNISVMSVSFCLHVFSCKFMLFSIHFPFMFISCSCHFHVVYSNAVVFMSFSFRPGEARKQYGWIQGQHHQGRISVRIFPLGYLSEFLRWSYTMARWRQSWTKSESFHITGCRDSRCWCPSDLLMPDIPGTWVVTDEGSPFVGYDWSWVVLPMFITILWPSNAHSFV